MTRNDKGLRRLPTGLPELDGILGGGLPAYSVIMLAGEPGTGKTILSQQALFANAAAGRKGMYLTTLSEPPVKAARFQSEFAFFDAERFGDEVVYMDIGETIRRNQYSHAVEVIASALRDNQPELVVIDSFKAIHDLASNEREVRTFVYDLAIELSAIQATTLLVGEYEEEDMARAPEFAVADGIIYMTLERGSVTRRHMRIAKMRGVSHTTQALAFEITPQGIALFARPRLTPRAAVSGPPTKTGVPGLDELLRGGVPAGAQMLVSGEAGSGKTTLGLQYLYYGAAHAGETGVYFSYEQAPDQLMAVAQSYGWDFAPLVESGRVRFLFTPLPEINADKEVIRIHRTLVDMKPRRAVVDSLTMFVHGIERPETVRQHAFSLVTLFGNAGCTALINTDPPAGSGLISRFGVEESIIDGVLVLRTMRAEKERRRAVEVYKLRGVNHASGDHLLRIGPEGLRVYARSEEAIR